MLIGRNVRLEPATVDSAALLADWFSDPAYLGDFNPVWPSSPQEWENNLAHPEGHENGFYLIVSNATDEPMGAAGYFNPFTQADFFAGREIWYQVHPRFRRRGIATQTACLLVNHLFDTVALPRIQATVAVDNEPSCRVVTAAGMQRDGVLRRVTFLHGRYVDMYLFAITREDWSDEAHYRAHCPPF